MTNIILPPGFADTREPKPEPEEPKALTRDDAIAALNRETADVLAELPPGDGLDAFTRLLVSRHVLGIVTGKMPPTMHPQYELIAYFVRKTPSSPWMFLERWVRAVGSQEPLLRVDENFNVMPMEDV